MVVLALAIHYLEVVFTQSNSVTHQAFVIELFSGGEVTQTGVVSDYQCGATVQGVATS